MCEKRRVLLSAKKHESLRPVSKEYNVNQNINQIEQDASVPRHTIYQMARLFISFFAAVVGHVIHQHAQGDVNDSGIHFWLRHTFLANDRTSN